VDIAMTIWTTPSLEPEVQGIDELPLSTGRYISESFQHGLEETPTAQTLRALEVMGAKGQPEDMDITDPMSGAVIGRLPARPVEKIPIEEARRRVKEEGLTHQIDLGSRTEIEAPALDIMMDHARARAHREAQLARGPSGVLPGVAATGASFFAGALDPLSVGAFAMPLVGVAGAA
jgi:hypothetical protein